jgi:hypothetical protein
MLLLPGAAGPPSPAVHLLPPDATIRRHHERKQRVRSRVPDRLGRGTMARQSSARCSARLPVAIGAAPARRV